MKQWIFIVALICIVVGVVGLISNITADDIGGILPDDFTDATGLGNLQLIFLSFSSLFLVGGFIYVVKG